MPSWKDGCNHEKSAYVGTYEAIIARNDHPERLTYDLYIYEDRRGLSTCIRYGNEPHEYLSPGPLMNVIKYSAQDEIYAGAVECMLKHGKITYTRN